MTPEELKKSILQLAIQGKLVEQRPEEGTADDLYAQIQAEKQRLIKDGKIKKEKPLPEITDDEIPFDIPDSWKWVRIGKVAFTISAGGDKPKDFSASITESKKIPVVANGVSNDGVIGYTAFPTAKAGTITVAGRGTIGFSMYRDYDYCPVVRLIVVDIPRLNNLYLQYVLQAMPEKSLGTSIPQLTVPMLYPKVIPLPPLEEQKRIVAKIEELLPLVDKYADAYNRLEELNKTFPGDLKKSILQYAIQGKLVEQRPEEGVADDLYAQIQAEKQRLIKEGKIKKDKRLSDLEVDNVPFDIPDSWRWTRLGCIVYKLTDGTHKTPKYTDTGIKFVSVKDMSNGKLDLSNTKFITENEHNELYSRCNPEKGDILLSKVGTTGVPAIIETDEPFSLFVSVALLKYSRNLIFDKYLYYMLQSPLVQLQATENTRGVGNKNWVLDAIANTLVVLPPLKEQKRIVEKINVLLDIVGKIQV